MSIKPWLRLFTFCTFLLTCHEVLAQVAGPPAGLETESIYTRGTLSQEQMQKLAEFIDQKQLQDGKDLVKPRTAAERALKAFKALNVDCNVASAIQISRSTSKDVASSSSGLYEAACANGTGFIIMIRPDKQVAALSCFAIDAALSTNAVGSDSTGMPTVQCKLPENANASMRASHILSQLGVTCKVVKTAWLGQDAKTNHEHYEATCDNNMHHVIHAPVPGYPGNIGTTDCAASAVPCVEPAVPTTAASSPDARPTLQWFKDTLAKNNVSCDTKQARIVGRESTKKRYVVEFECADKPQGLVAYVPSPGDTTNGFESMDCAAAVKRSVSCQFSKVAGN